MEVYIRHIGLHMFDLILARGWQAIHSLPHTRPRRWRWWKWSYTPPSPAPSASSPLLQILSSSVCVCVVGWKRGWCYTEGESGAMRPVRTFSRPPTAGWLSAKKLGRLLYSNLPPPLRGMNGINSIYYKDRTGGTCDCYRMGHDSSFGGTRME